MATKKVIDISQFNTISNYRNIVNNSDGCIVRLGYRGYGTSGSLVTDPTFSTHVHGLEAARSSIGGSKSKYAIGIYWFSQAISTDEAYEEVDYVYNKLATLGLISLGTSLGFPVYIDSEYASPNHNGRGDTINKSRRTQYILDFCYRMKNRYNISCGLYCSDSWLVDMLDLTSLKNSSNLSSFWIANYSSSPKNLSSWDGHQYTSTYKISGESGSFDASYFNKWWIQDEVPTVDLSTLTITTSPSVFMYDGYAKVPSINIRNGSTYIPDSLFTKTYAHNINASQGNNKATATVAAPSTGVIYNGKKYVGSKTIQFVIDPINFSDAQRFELGTTFSSIEYPLNKTPFPTPSIMDLDRIIRPDEGMGHPYELILNQDFVIYAYEDYLVPGNAAIVIDGAYGKKFDSSGYNTGNYQGRIEIPYTVTQGNMNNRTIEFLYPLLEDNIFKFDGSAVKPAIKITGGNGTLDSSDYTVSYKYNDKIPEPLPFGGNIVNMPTVTATGKSGLVNGKLSKTFRLSTFQLSNCCKIVIDETFVYDGEEKRPIPKVYDKFLYDNRKGVDGDFIIPNEYYYIYYSDNINAGSATIEIRPTTDQSKRLWTTTYFGTFTIEPKDITEYIDDCVLDQEIYFYNGLERKPTVTFMGIGDLDPSRNNYYLEYDNNIEVGEATIYIRGKNNYKGTIIKKFIIDYQPLQYCIAKYGYPTLYSRYRIIDDENYPFRIYDPLMETQLQNGVDYLIENSARFRMEGGFWLFYYKCKPINPGYVGTAEFRFRMIREQDLHIPTEEELADDGNYEYGHEGYIVATGINIDFGNDNEKSPGTPEDLKEYDFNIFGYSLADTYDLDNGSNIDDDGVADYDYHEPPEPDDGRFEFGCVGVLDEHGRIVDVIPATAGCYDFGADYGVVSPDSIAKGVYDFNILSASKSDWFKPGTEYWLENTPLYAVYTNKKAERIAFGRFTVYDKIIANGRIRLTESDGWIEQPCCQSGWFETSDLINLNAPSINDYVSITGKIYRNPAGAGGSAEVEEEKYYIVDFEEGASYPYGLSKQVLATPIAYAAEENITIIERNSTKRSSRKKKSS